MSQVSQRTATDLADDLLSSVASNCEPDEVFPLHRLVEWAVSNDYITLDTVASTYEPDDVFTTAQLDDWAVSNGYVST